jgi:hypothetical protein
MEFGHYDSKWVKNIEEGVRRLTSVEVSKWISV